MVIGKGKGKGGYEVATVLNDAFLLLYTQGQRWTVGIKPELLLLPKSGW